MLGRPLQPPDSGVRPRYLDLLEQGGFPARVDAARAMLAACRVCPRDCDVDRLENETAACHTGRWARVSTWYPHFGEELCLRGSRGSGTVFFAYCNLRCVFCQNHDIAMGDGGRPMEAEALAAVMLELQDKGCHNINWVSPEHVVPQLVEALAIAAHRGLRLPIVYNTSGYDSLASLRLLDGLVDIYMPDIKTLDATVAKRWLAASDYPEVVRRAVLEMHRQVGQLVVGPEGLARSGLLVRHLVMPGQLEDARAILSWIRQTLGTETWVNLMDQYKPAYRAGKIPQLSRSLQPDTWLQAVAVARDLGLQRLEGLS